MLFPLSYFKEQMVDILSQVFIVLHTIRSDSFFYFYTSTKEYLFRDTISELK